MSILSIALCVALSVTQDPILEGALERAGDNHAQLEEALGRLDGEERDGLEFLLEHMSAGDLTSLSADFLVEHVTYAYRAWREAPWSSAVPEQHFLENVLPYASINERRDAWRADFYERFRPLVANATSPSEAAAILNQKMFELVGVRYSTKRPKADQSPYESMEAGLASCTGLSVLLIDACRAVGVPARFVGVPSWSDDSGNHSWVEIWDNGWRFTGAAEPTGSELDKAWFTGRASNARANSEKYGIFAVSFVKTGQRLPMVWKPDADEVHAVDVTHRYTAAPEVVPEGFVRVRFEARSFAGRKRLAARVRVSQPGMKGVGAANRGSFLFEGVTRDESFDANDYLSGLLPLGEELSLLVHFNGTHIVDRITPDSETGLLSFEFPFGLTAEEARRAEADLFAGHRERIREEQAAAMKGRFIFDGKLDLPFWYSVNGDAPEGGRSLWISLHGGGGAPSEVNDKQWENQKKLYDIPEGVYVAPRAPTNTWNLWHEEHIDKLLGLLIQNMIVFENVNPNRVYLLGYSAGGDGVYQLAPRMADRFAGAAMMAGHPNDARPDGLRNLSFTLHMGGEDSAYDRNKVAADWKKKLAALQAADPGGYDHWVEIHEGKKHWMDREDAAALPWMAERTRDPRPKRIVWLQSSRTHWRFYWLINPEPVAGSRVVVERDGQEIRILEAEGVESLIVRLDDSMLDLDRPVVVRQGDEVLFEGVVPRDFDVIRQTISERGDPAAIYYGQVTVQLHGE